MQAKPLEDAGKAEFVPVHRAANESVPRRPLDLDEKAIAPQEDVGGSEGDALIAIEKAVVVPERLRQRRRFFFKGIVIAVLRAKNRGLHSAFIPDSMKAAEQLDQSMLHPVDFRYRKIIRHLLGEALQQITVAGH
jgi:hypothetical protein